MSQNDKSVEPTNLPVSEEISQPPFTSDAGSEVPATRRHFTKLILSNPNHFGTMPELDLPVIEAIKTNTFYEEIECLGLNPETDTLEAVVNIKRPNGYLSNSCGKGSHEYVRFFVQHGSSWVDLGSVSFPVYDLPSTLPVSYNVTIKLGEQHHSCRHENPLNVRAILSWGWEPTPGNANYLPVWGNVTNSTVQVEAIRRGKHSKLSELVSEGLLTIDQQALSGLNLSQVVEVAELQPLSYTALKQMYQQDKAVQPHRYGFAHVLQVEQQPITTGMLNPQLRVKRNEPNVSEAKGDTATATLAAAAPASSLVSGNKFAQDKELLIDLADIFKQIEQTKGNTTYEQLTCVGYDPTTGLMGGVIEVKLNSGYSGNLCSLGSQEYVGFYALYAGSWHNLGIAQVSVHDLSGTGHGHTVKYAAMRPVNLPSANCQKLESIPVRAILSWQTPPTGPGFVPTWGNVVNTHVQPMIGSDTLPGDMHINLQKVGGVEVDRIDNGSGLAYPFSGGVSSVYYDRPFSGEVSVAGYFTNAPDNFDDHSGIVNVAHPLLYRVFFNSAGAATPTTIHDPLAQAITAFDGTRHYPTQNPATNPPVSFAAVSGVVNLPATTSSDYYTYMAGGGQGVDDSLLAVLNAAGLAEGNYTISVVGFRWDGSQYVEAGAPLLKIKNIRVYNRYAYNAPLLDGGTYTAYSPEVSLTSTTGDCGDIVVGDDFAGTYAVADHYFGEMHIGLVQITIGGALAPINPARLDGGSSSGRSYQPPMPSNTTGVSGTWTISTSSPDKMSPCGYTVVLEATDRAVVNSNPIGGNHSQIGVGFCLRAAKPSK